MADNAPSLDDDLDTPDDAATTETVVGSPIESALERETRYAVYDNTLLRFVSGVVDTLDEADELLQSCPEEHDCEIREV